MRERYPRAAEAIMDSTIVDDTLDSVNSEEEAIELLRGLQEDLRHLRDEDREAHLVSRRRSWQPSQKKTDMWSSPFKDWMRRPEASRRS